MRSPTLQALIAPFALFTAASAVGCCAPYRFAPQVVDTSPVDTAPIPPPDASVSSIFRRDAGWVPSLAPGPASLYFDARAQKVVRPGIVVRVTQYHTTSEAARDFESLRDSFASDDKSATATVTEHGTQDNRCAVSICMRYHLHGDVPRLPLTCAYDNYHSFVVFQKGPFFIQVEESSEQPGGPAKNRVIEHIAEALRTATPRDHN